MFIAALFMISREMESTQLINGSAQEGINKSWYSHMLEYCSAIKRNEVLDYHARSWMSIEHMLSKKARHKDHMLHDSIYLKCPYQANRER